MVRLCILTQRAMGKPLKDSMLGKALEVNVWLHLHMKTALASEWRMDEGGWE